MAERITNKWLNSRVERLLWLEGDPDKAYTLEQGANNLYWLRHKRAGQRGETMTIREGLTAQQMDAALTALMQGVEMERTRTREAMHAHGLAMVCDHADCNPFYCRHTAA